MKKRVILIVLDSVGIGELPDAGLFHDEASHTLGNIFAARGHLNIPNMTRLGLTKIENSRLPHLGVVPEGCYCRLAETTLAKDTTCGHWEIAGLPLEKPFQTYPNGFPKRILDAFSEKTGRGVIGNEVASGTEIIQRLGDEHVRTGDVIVYTSADSVFQIAAHEEVVPLDELYRLCETAREMLVGDDLVGRVIARPFIGANGQYTRTENRRDFAVAPFSDTILDALSARGMETVGVGKIEDIFCHRGITTVNHTKDNAAGTEATLAYVREGTGDFIFTNLVDTDMLYGHRNDVEGYARALETFDARLPELEASMRDGDILMITADHGCDPVTPSTDHSREYIPLIMAGKPLKKGVNLGTRSSFADIGATVFEYLTGETWSAGRSFWKEIEA